MKFSNLLNLLQNTMIMKWIKNFFTLNLFFILAKNDGLFPSAIESVSDYWSKYEDQEEIDAEDTRKGAYLILAAVCVSVFAYVWCAWWRVPPPE